MEFIDDKCYCCSSYPNIVVMLVVGMVALAALVAIIPPPTKNMSVYV